MVPGYLYRAGSQRLDVGSCPGSPWPEWWQLSSELGAPWSQSFAPPGRSAGTSSKRTTQSNGSLLGAKRVEEKNINDRHDLVNNTAWHYLFRHLRVVYIQFSNSISGIILLAPLLAPGTFKRHPKQLRHTSVADNVPNPQTNYSDSPVGIQK